ncbi:uncharacterized protein [Coffea arabica]|uniref:Reverse transcriptase domain-containing protein n=1 Tax=Coffea arabica TaxID=13443 RepID=A0ABM4VCM4_COFAR
MAAICPPDGGQPAPPTFQRKSFSELFTKNSQQPTLSFAAQEATHKGEPALIFPQAAVEALASPFRFALIGKFSRRRPKLEEVRKFIASLDLRENPVVGLLDVRHVLIQLNNEADFHRVWFRRIWYVSSFPMRVFKWTTDFHVDRESSVVPLWLQLPKLPLHFFNKEVIFQIASMVGNPLLVDAATLAVSRPSVARVCVEMDLLRSTPSRVWIGNGNHAGFWQELVVENLPRYCSHCFRQGHDVETCHVLKPELRGASGHHTKTTGTTQLRLAETSNTDMPDGPLEGNGERPSVLIQDAAVIDGAKGEVNETVTGKALVAHDQLIGGTPHEAEQGDQVQQSCATIPAQQERKMEEDYGTVAVEGIEVVLPHDKGEERSEDVGSGLPARVVVRSAEGQVEDIQDTQRRVGTLSPRGKDLIRQEESSLETGHIDTGGTLELEEVVRKERMDARSRGLRVGLPSDRTLRSMCTQQDREDLWNALLQDKPAFNPWFLVGDFNVVTNTEEKRGGLPFRLSEGSDFLNFMALAGVSDAGFSGSRFTWCNNRSGTARIWKRLDRLLLCGSAMELPYQFMVQHLGRDPSDHAPLLLSVDTRLDNKPKPFRFLNIWTTHPDFLGVIKDCWVHPVNGSPLQVLASKLRNVKNALKQWSRTTFGDIFEGVRSAERVVTESETAYDLDPTEQRRSELHHARARLRRALVVEEGFWRQKARVKWLSDGDRNTKYFHSLVTERRRRAVIHRVRGTAGEWIEGECQIGEAAVGFFKDLFTAEGDLPSLTGLEIIPKLITDQENSRLTDIPSLTEVKDIVFAMDGESAAGPDGFTGKFFTFAWEVVASDLYRAVVSFFCGAELPRSITATSIVLLPKVENPQDFKHFRPISLCNFTNKIISKLLSARLAMILPRIISPQQSGFVQGRQITDNFLLAQELVADIGKSNRGGNVVIKLDMMKAYDKVSWPFLLQVLRYFGFSETWIDMIWRLISNVWFSVLVNGGSNGFFRSSRGLRQGDPISPALFVIGAEVLSRTLNTLPTQRGFTPFKVPPHCSIITHLAFADDVIIFSSGAKSSLRLIKRVLDDYNEASGQRINPQKSCFLTHPRAPSQRAAVVNQILGYNKRDFPIRYLGCPLYTGRSKKVYYTDIYNAVANRILSWKNQILSLGGRVVLIQSVLSSMPIHLLAAASPPKGMLMVIEKLFAKFLWGSSNFGDKFHWIRWADLCRPKDEGGVGLRGLKQVYDSFSIKLWWKFRQQQSLWAKFMSQKYCAGHHPCLADIGHPGSQVWQRMVTMQRFGEDNISWVVREGALDFWHDNWMGSGALCDKVEVFHDHSVVDFVDRRAWNVDMLHQFLDGELVTQVLEIDPPTDRGNDTMVWALTNSGVFSTASAYSLIRQSNDNSWLFGRIWQQGLPVKVSFFMLRLLQGRLPLMDRLKRFGVCGPSRCLCCQNPQEEDLNHVFCSGEGARLVWRHFESTAGEFSGVHTVRHMVWSCWLRRGTNDRVKFLHNILPSVVCWVLWKARNEGVFEGRKMRIRPTVNRIVQFLHDFLQSRFPGVQLSAPTWEGLLLELGSHQRRMVIRPVYWRDLDELMMFKQYFTSITHCYREANAPADHLANFGADSSAGHVFNTFSELPQLVLAQAQQFYFSAAFICVWN